MPGLNQKGPMGQGPLTGGQQGRCAQPNENTATDKNGTLQQVTSGVKGGAGCRRRGGSGRGVGQGSGMGKRNSR
jgi:Family of unknown function (DUF5320)